MEHQQEQNLSAQLKDIKPLLDIPDNSVYLYWGLIVFTALMVLAIVYLIAKNFGRTERSIWKRDMLKN